MCNKVQFSERGSFSQNHSAKQRTIPGKEDDQAEKGTQNRRMGGEWTTKKTKDEGRTKGTIDQDPKEEAVAKKDQRKDKWDDGYAWVV